MIRSKVNIQKLREFAFNEIPKDWALREILLAEAEEIDVVVFLARIPIWLRLTAIRGGARK
jgi:hypothetical protein